MNEAELARIYKIQAEFILYCIYLYWDKELRARGLKK